MAGQIKTAESLGQSPAKSTDPRVIYNEQLRVNKNTIVARLRDSKSVLTPNKKGEIHMKAAVDIFGKPAHNSTQLIMQQHAKDLGFQNPVYISYPDVMQIHRDNKQLAGKALLKEGLDKLHAMPVRIPFYDPATRRYTPKTFLNIEQCARPDLIEKHVAMQNTLREERIRADKGAEYKTPGERAAARKENFPPLPGLEITSSDPAQYIGTCLAAVSGAENKQDVVIKVKPEIEEEFLKKFADAMKKPAMNKEGVAVTYKDKDGVEKPLLDNFALVSLCAEAGTWSSTILRHARDRLKTPAQEQSAPAKSKARKSPEQTAAEALGR